MGGSGTGRSSRATTPAAAAVARLRQQSPLPSSSARGAAAVSRGGGGGGRTGTSTSAQLLTQAALLQHTRATEARIAAAEKGPTAEDARKLQAGVELSIASGQLARQDAPPAYMSIDVMGKTPDEVCDIILRDMGAAVRDSGGIVVLCGLSGTGKGTTVRRLGARLAAGKSTAWSNGNVFRSLTLLAATWCEQQQPGGAFDAAAAVQRRAFAALSRIPALCAEDLAATWNLELPGDSGVVVPSAVLLAGRRASAAGSPPGP